MLDTLSDGFPSVASTATDPPMSLTRSPVTSSKSRLVGASMVHCAISPVGIPPVLPVRPVRTPNDISHFPKVKMYRDLASRRDDGAAPTAQPTAGRAHRGAPGRADGSRRVPGR